MPSVKQDSIKYHFLSLWYDSTWDWTHISLAIGEYTNHYAKDQTELAAAFFKSIYMGQNNLYSRVTANVKRLVYLASFRVYWLRNLLHNQLLSANSKAY